MMAKLMSSLLNHNCLYFTYTGCIMSWPQCGKQCLSIAYAHQLKRNVQSVDIIHRYFNSRSLCGFTHCFNHRTKSQLCLDQRIKTASCCNCSLNNRSYSQQGEGRYDESRDSRRQKLWLATLVSGFIGVGLLTAIGFREYKRMGRRAQGIEELKVRQYGNRPVLLRYRGYVLLDWILEDIKRIHTFEVRQDDTWIVSFPKAGTTWVQEIVYLISTDLDFAGAKTTQIDERCPYLEFVMPGTEAIAAMPSPRLIKSHLPFSLLPNQIKEKKPKIIYIMRNPKDTVVSFYFFAVKFLAHLTKFHGTFEQYCELFAQDLVPYGPWWKHVLEGWKHRQDENVLFLTYEDLKKDPTATVEEIARFLGKNLTGSQVAAIVQHCNFDKMKYNKAVNYEWLKDGSKKEADSVDFMRKGQVGEWKAHLSADIVSKLDEMVSSKLAPAGMVVQDTPLENEEKKSPRSWMRW